METGGKLRFAAVYFSSISSIFNFNTSLNMHARLIYNKRMQSEFEADTLTNCSFYQLIDTFFQEKKLKSSHEKLTSIKNFFKHSEFIIVYETQIFIEDIFN
mgnify:CR=1 FL=1